MPGLIREARDMQGIRKEKKESEAKPAGTPQSEGPPPRPGKKS
jgi:hypothetical protein